MFVVKIKINLILIQSFYLLYIEKGVIMSFSKVISISISIMKL